MKKFIALLLALVMCIGLVACGNTNTPSTPGQDPTTPPPSESVTPPASEDPTPSAAPTAGDYVADAKSYVRAMYKDKAGKVLRDFDVVASVKIGEFTYDVTWTTDAAEENVKIGEVDNNKITIDINEKPGEEDLVFTLTATVTADGKSESTTFEFYVPGTPAKADGPEFVAVPEVGGTYKFALVQGELGQTLFFTGAMSGNYLATSENPAEAVDVTIEEVEGGVRLFFMDGETKTYIDIHEYAEGKAGVRLTTEPTAVFVWNEECGVYTADVAGAPRYLGTYSTYNTISASDIKYIAGENVGKIGISQFPAGFCTVTYEIKTIEGQPAAGTSALFYLTQGELGQTLYFTGAMSGNYLATATDPTKGVNVTVEEVEGGYRLFFMDGATKTYIDIHEYAEGKAGIRLTTEPTAVFVWNEECGVFTADVAGAPRYLGTYSTYNTISASDIKYIAGENVGKIGVSQFPAGFGFIVYDFVAAEGQPAADATYKFALTQGELGQTLFFAGFMSGNYLATTENGAAAADVTIEAVEGGFRFYFMDGETKTYIDIHEYAEGKAGIRLTTEPTAVFVWNEECGVFTADVAGAPRYLGTYSTYNTMSASDIKYIAGENVGKIGISQFPAYFGTLSGSAPAAAPEKPDPIEPENPTEPTEPTEPVVSTDPAADSTLTVADAIALGASKAHNTYTEGKYYVTGVITEVYNETYGNMKITDDAGNILTVYGTYGADGSVRYDALEVKPVAGDTVTVYGILGQYNDAPQMKNGWITEHTVATGGTTEPEEPVETPDEPEKPADPAADSTLSVVDALALGVSKEHNVYTEGKYYVTGVITEVTNDKYGNMKIADEKGNELTVYGTYSADGTVRYDGLETKPVAGDTITVYGIIGQYNGTAQVKNGWITAHTAVAPTVEVETIVTPKGVTLEIADGIVTIYTPDGEVISGKGTVNEEFYFVSDWQGEIVEETAVLVTYAPDAVISIKDTAGNSYEVTFGNKFYLEDKLFVISVEMGELLAGPAANSFGAIDLLQICLDVHLTMEGKDMTSEMPAGPDTTKRPVATQTVIPVELVGTWKMFAYDAPEGGYYTPVENEDLLLFGETSWTHMVDGKNALGLPSTYKWVDEDTINIQNAFGVAVWDMFMSDDGVLICRYVDPANGVNVEYYCVKISDEV